MSDATHVRYVRPNGKTAFNMLVDNGADTLSFASGHGFVNRAYMESQGLTLVQGWLTEAEMDQERKP